MPACATGYYPDPKKKSSTTWQQAQLDYIDTLLELAGLSAPAQQVGKNTESCVGAMCWEGSCTLMLTHTAQHIQHPKQTMSTD